MFESLSTIDLHHVRFFFMGTDALSLNLTKSHSLLLTVTCLLTLLLVDKKNSLIELSVGICSDLSDL